MGGIMAKRVRNTSCGKAETMNESEGRMSMC